MLFEAFGLRADPFLDTADPAYYYETLACANWRRRLYECVSSGHGLAVIVGPIGAGKTTLVNAVQQDMLAADRCRVGSILDPTFSAESELLEAISAALRFDLKLSASLRDQKEDLKRSLFETATLGHQRSVLFIDEAQLLHEALFEPLRMLLNYQMDDGKLLTVALSGQPELSQALVRHPNLSDRVALWLEMRQLAYAEAAELINYRLRRAGYKGESSPFEESALVRIWQLARGLPRRLTALARAAMEAAAGRRSRSVSAADVEAALRSLAPPLGGRDAGVEPTAIAAAFSLKKRWWGPWKNTAR